jgi:tetratricopeptide (TPR) repeat protein
LAASTPPQVFISYSQDDAAHKARVLALANRLRRDGIDATIDQYVPFPPEGWSAWCETRVRTADFVLMVCTETYLRRFNREEAAGVGHGVIWEARLIRTLLARGGSASGKFIPVLFDAADRAYVPLCVQDAQSQRIYTEEGYANLYRLLTAQPLVRAPALGPLRPMPERDASAEPAPASPPPSSPGAASAHPRVAELFVGREDELARVAAALFPASGTRRPVVVSGMPGVGKSYLVDRVFFENRDRFPGGYHKLALDPANPGAAADLMAALRDRLQLPATAAPANALLTPLALLHIENADNFAAGRLVAEFCAALPGCAIVVSARFPDLGFAAGWPAVPLQPFDEKGSLAQLTAELGPDAPSRKDWPALAEALGHLPLALHLAAGYLRRNSAAEFLSLLRRKNLALGGLDPADPAFLQRSRALLSEAFDLSLDMLRQQGGPSGEAWRAGFAALGYLPASGFGASLGAAVAALDPDNFAEMAAAAAGLSLLERVPRGERHAFRLHPLLAELLRPRAPREAAIARTTEWFLARLPEGGDDQGGRWHEVHDETAALSEWLGQIPPADRVRIRDISSQYAMLNGPFNAWLRFCEAALADEITDADRSNFLFTLSYVAQRSGLLDRALAAAEEKRDLDHRRGANREAAISAGFIADILQARGQLDAALQIRTEEQLPVYQRLGDVRERAITQGKIADILQARGELDAALQIRTEEELPVFERLGDVRSRALTQGKIADILMARGQLDAALQIRTEEELPVYQRLGDVRSLLVGRANLALTLLQRAGDGDREEAQRLLRLALAEARRLGIPEAQQIEELIERNGLS